ncbi:N-ethylammeline chlorohydrolase [Desulfuribacillus stibiiarsenatis]|uniref:5-methylthioadenosine/S-adenosylhomocysteine deaminase n=2 Tax=Desulfuribacillus stibiiarsenatis TaxID=1390249 RepID=A0A1E5L413_9FIRM|nr:N-ethylammeline chlorohydrolase [Desulfuribacillus stibiiarsenatis]
MEKNWKPELLDIIIEGQIIRKVKKLSSDEIQEYKNNNYECIDLSGKVIMPGFVNTHGHAAMTLLRGYGDDLPLQEWLETKIWPFEGQLSDDDIYWGTKLAVIEMIQSGTTCFADMYFSMEHVAKAVEETGIRACLSRGLIGFSPNKDIALQESKDFIKKWHNKSEGRITCTLGPHAPYTCPPEFLDRVIALANELDTPLQIHISETKKEVEDCYNQYGMSPVEHLEKVGVFTRPTIAAHCVHLSDNDIEIFKKYDVKICHNPGSNLKLASGIAPIPKLLQEGLTVSIGTDGASSNNNLDMLEELRLTALIHKGASFDPLAIPARTALEIATIEGAKTLRIDQQVGTIIEGKQADIIAFDTEYAHYYPKFDLVSHIVYSANSRDISHVWVAGKQLLKNRELHMDTVKVFNKCEEIAQRIIAELKK